MSAPNIVDVATIVANTNAIALANTVPNQLLSNAADSGKVFKVNMIQIANVDGSNACDVTVKYHTAAALGGSAYSLVSTVSVPADSSLVVIDKNTSMYLVEDRSLSVTAGTADDLEAIISFEEIS